MAITYQDVRLARKRAYDRVRYELEKQLGKSTNVGRAGYTLIPVNKNMSQAELDYLYKYFTDLRKAEVKAYVSYEYEPKHVEKPHTIRNPYGREYRYKKSDEYMQTGYEPEEYWDDYELREQIHRDELEYEEQLEDEYQDSLWYRPEIDIEEPDEEDDTAPNYFDLVDELVGNISGINESAGHYVSNWVDSMINMLHTLNDTGVTPEQEVYDTIKANWEIWNKVETASRYMVNNYYGGRELMYSALSEMTACFGLHYSKTTWDIELL